MLFLIAFFFKIILFSINDLRFKSRKAIVDRAIEAQSKRSFLSATQERPESPFLNKYSETPRKGEGEIVFNA